MEASISFDGNTVTFENQSRYATSYFWDFGDQTTSTERHPQPHTYTEDGIYTIQLITQNYCCSDTLTSEVTIGNPTGIEDLAYKPFELRLNPVVDYLQFEWSGHQSYSLELYDVTGRLVLFEENTTSQNVDFQSVGAGVYVLRIKSDNQVYTEKVIKN